MSLSYGRVENNVDIIGMLRAKNTSLLNTTVTALINSGNSSIGGTQNVSGASIFGSTITVNSVVDVGIVNGIQTASINTLGGLAVALSLQAKSGSFTNGLGVGGNLVCSGTTSLLATSVSTLNIVGSTTAASIACTSLNPTGVVTSSSSLDSTFSSSNNSWSAAIQTLGGIFANKSIVSLASGSFGSNLSVGGAVSSASAQITNALSTGTLSVANNATFSTISTSGLVSANSMNISNTLNCVGAATISGTTTLNNNLSVAGNSVFSNSANLNSTLAVAGATSLSSLSCSSAVDVTVPVGPTPVASVILSGGLFVQKQIVSNSLLTVPSANIATLNSQTGNFTTSLATATLSATVINNTGNQTIGGVLNLPNTIVVSGGSGIGPVIQGGSNVASDVFRVRTNDTTNTSSRISVANNAMGSTNYDSGVTMYSLGSQESSTDYEKFCIGSNYNGPYMNYLYGGSGTSKPFNIFGGSIFTPGGNLSLASTLSVAGLASLSNVNTSGLLSSTNTTDSTSASSASAINTAGGLSVVKSANIGNSLSVVGATVLGATLSVTGATSLIAALTCGGTSTLNGATTINAAFVVNASCSVTGNTILTSFSATTGTFSSNVAISGTTIHTGIVTVNNASDVNTTTPNLSSVFTSGGLYISKALYVTTTSTLTGAVALGSTISVVGSATLAALAATSGTFSGNVSITGTTTHTGIITVNNTSDVNLTTPNLTSLFSSGGAYISKNLYVGANTTLTTLSATNISGSGTLNIAGASTLAALSATTITSSGDQTIGGALYLPNTVMVSGTSVSSPIIQGGTAVASDSFRIRTNDTNNPNTRISLANVAMGNTYYDSHLTLYSLGSSETSTNYERMSFGVNGTSIYLNHLFAGTGTQKSFNILSGSVFGIGGSLALNNTLSVGGLASFAAAINANNTTDISTSTPQTSSLFTAGGAYITKSLFVGGQINYPNTWYTVTVQSSLSVAQGGTGIPGNVWRFRTNDTTNTGARVSIGNAGMGNNFYDSQLSFYGLGVIEGVTGNTERITYGYNGTSGPFINQIYTGTGIARPLNIYSGALFSSGGALSLASTLSVASQTTFGAQCNYPSKIYTYTTSLAGTTGNTFRFRSTDATNTGVINSIANAAVSATTAYSTYMAFFSLGNTENNTTNTESLLIGCTGNGAVINPSAAGTGVTTKALTIYGNTFVNNGLATFANNVAVTGGNINLAGTTVASVSGSNYTFTLPSAPPSAANMVLTSSTTGATSWLPNDPLIFTGDGVSTPVAVNGTLKQYFFTQTLNNNSGQLTFYFTSNGTSGGTLLFTQILDVRFSGRPAASSTNPRLGVIGTEATRATNGSIGNFLVSSQQTVGGLGSVTVNGLNPAPSGTICYCTVLGI